MTALMAAGAVYVIIAGGGFLAGLMGWATSRPDDPAVAKDCAVQAFASIIWPVLLPYAVYLMIRDITHKEAE